MSVRVRFAPSPTGVLHVGGARTALFNWLFARSQGGRFILRIEDTDKERSTEEAMAAIYEGMSWLGLDWDEGPDIGGDFGPYLQTDRAAVHQKTIEALASSDRIYPLWLSADELQDFRDRARKSGEPLRYPGRDETWSMEDVLEARAQGRGPALLLKVPSQGEVRWQDLIKGEIKFDLKDIDDFVIVRGDGTPTYNFAVVLDDADMEISHVLRGDDHVSNTPKQLLLFDMLGKARPAMGHVPMILGPDGAKLSKRHGATAVGAYRDLGFVPEGMINYLALLGWALDDKTEVFSTEQLIKVFSLERVGSTPSVFDQQKLTWLNGVHLRSMPVERRTDLVEKWLESRSLWPVPGRDRQFLEKLTQAVGDRLKLLTDIEEYGRFALVDEIVYDPKAVKKVGKGPQVERVLQETSTRLEPLEVFDEQAIEKALEGLAEDLELKPGQVFQPIRVAVTGSTTSPGIHETLALAGKDRTLSRLKDAQDVFLQAAASQQP